MKSCFQPSTVHLHRVVSSAKSVSPGTAACPPARTLGKVPSCSGTPGTWTKAKLSLTYRTLNTVPSLRRAVGPSFQISSAKFKTVAAMDSFPTPVVSTEWLEKNLGQVKVLDASWYMPAANRDNKQEFTDARIPGAVFFDMDGIKDYSSQVPHMLPTEASFAAAADALGVANDDPVVVYDGAGLFSAARVWWTFRVFGHRQVSVLAGGLPKWKAEGRALESAAPSVPLTAGASAAEDAHKQAKDTKYKAKLNTTAVRSVDDMLANVNSRKEQVVDARAQGRFDGTTPEPRAGLRGGHIPGSVCIPFQQVLTEAGELRSPEEVKAAVAASGLTADAPVVTSCGTGVTACILTLAMESVGMTNTAVYDGSWSEWGAREDTPVATASEA